MNVPTADSLDGICYDLMLLMRGGGPLTDDENIDIRQVREWVGTAIAELLDGEVLLAAQQNRPINGDLYQNFSSLLTPMGRNTFAGTLPSPSLQALGKSHIIEAVIDDQLPVTVDTGSVGAKFTQINGWGRWKGNRLVALFTGKTIEVFADRFAPAKISGRYIPARPWESVPNYEPLPIPSRWRRQIRLRVLDAEGRAILGTQPDKVNDGTTKPTA